MICNIKLKILTFIEIRYESFSKWMYMILFKLLSILNNFLDPLTPYGSLKHKTLTTKQYCFVENHFVFVGLLTNSCLLECIIILVSLLNVIKHLHAKVHIFEQLNFTIKYFWWWLAEIHHFSSCSQMVMVIIAVLL